ncbi:hypothetical protein LVJ94_35320 [Pendulispora rubella]|uniref:Uncharacterized protein n=1 Tax=Pendulispora rubella TaxID=2741070 RepID=A0ABZ2KXY6_9BACT
MTPTLLLSEELVEFIQTFPSDAQFILEQATLVEHHGYVELDRRDVELDRRDGRRKRRKDDRALVLLQTASTGNVWWQGDPAVVRPVTAMQRKTHFEEGQALEHLLVLERGARIVIGRSGMMEATCPRFFDLHWDGEHLVSKGRLGKSPESPRVAAVTHNTATA